MTPPCWHKALTKGYLTALPWGQTLHPEHHVQISIDPWKRAVELMGTDFVHFIYWGGKEKTLLGLALLHVPPSLSHDPSRLMGATW